MSVSANPYPGARPFGPEPSSAFKGREEEARRLLSLVISQRMVVIHGPEGSGKTSLLRQKLIPDLRHNGFAVLPLGNISGPPPKTTSNGFMYQLLCRIHQGNQPEAFTEMTLTHFLKGLVSEDGLHYLYQPTADDDNQPSQSPPMVLVIDALEDLSKTGAPEERAAFFQQLDEAMIAEPHLWIVLCVSNDGLPLVESFEPLMTHPMRARFSLSYLKREAAMQAVQEPARDGKFEIDPDLAGQLCDGCSPSPGFVNPYLLQMAATLFWDGAAERNFANLQELDLAWLGEKDQMAARYLARAFHAASSSASLGESEMRRWCAQHLTDTEGNPSLIVKGQSETIDNIASVLAQGSLVTEETQAWGTIWRCSSRQLAHSLHEEGEKQKTREMAARRRKQFLMIPTVIGVVLMALILNVWKPEPQPVVRGYISEEDLIPYNNQLFEALIARSEYLLGKAGETGNQTYYQEALTDLLHAHQLHPQDRSVLRWIAVTYENLGQPEMASQYSAKAKALQ